jgi:hypothetical protein
MSVKAAVVSCNQRETGGDERETSLIIAPSTATHFYCRLRAISHGISREFMSSVGLLNESRNGAKNMTTMMMMKNNKQILRKDGQAPESSLEAR